MGEPRLLSSEELERHLTEGCTSEKEIRGHLAALKADNARLFDGLGDSDHHDDCQFLRMCAQRRGTALGMPVPDTTCDCHKAVQYQSHPGAALLEEMETLRQRQALWEEAAQALYGYTEFSGPCAHGRDPWDRCDDCGKKNAVAAAVGLLNKDREEHRKALVRARNEGRKQAENLCEAMAKEADQDREEASGGQEEAEADGAGAALWAARNRIRALKEPEE